MIRRCQRSIFEVTLDGQRYGSSLVNRRSPTLRYFHSRCRSASKSGSLLMVKEFFRKKSCEDRKWKCLFCLRKRQAAIDPVLMELYTVYKYLETFPFPFQICEESAGTAVKVVKFVTAQCQFLARVSKKQSSYYCYLGAVWMVVVQLKTLILGL